MAEKHIAFDGPAQLDDSHALVEDLQTKLDCTQAALPAIRERLNALHSRQIRYLLLIDEKDARIAELEARLATMAPEGGKAPPKEG